jgi:carboxyl-terminal processing protease
VVGTTSHGKGSVQAIYPLPGGYAIRITTAYYVTPLGRQLQSAGIEPDIVVDAKDQQLEAAVDLLLKHAPSVPKSP